MNKQSTAIILFVSVLLAACSAPATPTPTPPTLIRLPTVPPIIPTSTVAPQPSTSPNTIDVSDDDKGKALTASVRARIRVVLHSTYWQFANVSNPAIKQLGAPAVAPDPSARIPGTGAGTITVEYQAVAPGQAMIQASRTTCGEALLCAEDQRNWQVTVIVK